MFSVLIVEDEPDLREMWSEYLRSLGHNVWSFGTLSSLQIWLAQDNTADIAFVDWHLPDAIGTDTVAAIRSRLPDCKIVAATGLAASQLVQSDVDYVLSKPFRIATLRDVVDRFTGDA